MWKPVGISGSCGEIVLSRAHKLKDKGKRKQPKINGMYIYNVTINIQEEVHQEWLQWMKTEHIPDMLGTKKFTKALMSRVMVEEAMGGITYSIQYTCINKEMLQRYFEEDAVALRAKTKPFEGRFVAFRTELEVISEQKE